jgi:hypothetical protein
MTDHRLPSDDAADRAIDRAIRELMSIEPAPGFRHRVMRRLSDAEPARWSWIRHGLAAAAVAILLLLAIWMRPSPRSERSPIAKAPESPTRVTPPAPIDAGTAPPSRSVLPPARTAPPPRRLAGGAAARPDRIVRAASLPAEAGGDEGKKEGNDDSQSTDAVASADRLAVAPIAVDAIVIKDIVVAPIPVVRR